MLTSRQQREGLLLLGLMLIGMLLEMLGIGLIIPITSILISDPPLAGHQWANHLTANFENLERSSLVVGGMGFLVAVYLAKIAFLGFLLWRQQGFVYGLQADISRRIFSGYLGQPYTFHLQRNSAKLILNATTEVSQFVGLIQSLLLFVAEILVCTGIVIILLLVEPAGTLFVSLALGCAGWIFYRATKAQIISLGDARQIHEGLRIQHLQQGLGAVKDVKVLGREDEFLSQYDRHNVGSAQVSRLHQTLQQIPRLGLELLAVSGLAILVTVMVVQEKVASEILPVLGVFGVAAFRLIPAVNRIIITAQTIRFVRPAVNTLSAEFCAFETLALSAKASPMPFSKEIVLDRVAFRYPQAPTDSLRNISLKIPAGHTVGFIGPSGSGKSTLVDVILGLLTPDRGVVTADGVDIQTNLRGWQTQIGYVPQTIYLTDDSLRRNVAFGLPDEKINDRNVWRALAAAQLDDFVHSLPDGLETHVGERGVRLSGGQRQRIGIARALYHDPAILVLDEATSALDSDTEQEVMEAIAALHGLKTVIIVAHRLTTLAGCDQVFKIIEGCLVDQGAAKPILPD